MKKVIIIVFFLLISLVAQGQRDGDRILFEKGRSEDMEQLLADALKHGEKHDGFSIYCLNNKKNKSLYASEAVKFLRNKGYITISATDKSVLRYGAVRELLDKVEFVLDSDYSAFAYAQFNQIHVISVKGSFFRPQRRDVYMQKTNARWAGSKFEAQNDVLWTGDIAEGLIHGAGIGFHAIGDTYYTFKGSFSHGLPTTEISVEYVTKADMADAYYKKPKWKTGVILPADLSTLLPNLKTTDRLLKKAITGYFIDEYRMRSSSVLSVYENLIKAVSKPDYLDKSPSSEEHSSVSLFCRIYGELGYDPANLLPKANEMKDAYHTWEVFSDPFRKRYWGGTFWSLLSGIPEWYNDNEKDDRNKLNECLSIAKTRKSSSEYGLKPFFSKMEVELKKKKDDFERIISQQRVDFDRAVARAREDNAEYHEKYRKVISEDLSKSPSGEFVSYGLLTSDKCYENDGVICFKSGSNEVRYNMRFNRYGELECYYIKYGYGSNLKSLEGKEYKSEKEMIDAILSANR